MFEHHKKQHLTSLPQQSSTRFEQPMHMLQQPIQQNQSWSIGCQKSLCLHYGKPMQDSMVDVWYICNVLGPPKF